MILILFKISADNPTIKNITERKKNAAPTKPDHILGLKVPLVTYVHRRTISKAIPMTKKISDIIEKKDRSLAGKSAPSEGLFLARVEYPDSIYKYGK